MKTLKLLIGVHLLISCFTLNSYSQVTTPNNFGITGNYVGWDAL